MKYFPKVNEDHRDDFNKGDAILFADVNVVKKLIVTIHFAPFLRVDTINNIRTYLKNMSLDPSPEGMALPDALSRSSSGIAYFPKGSPRDRMNGPFVHPEQSHSASAEWERRRANASHF